MTEGDIQYCHKNSNRILPLKLGLIYFHLESRWNDNLFEGNIMNWLIALPLSSSKSFGWKTTKSLPKCPTKEL